MSNWTRRIRRRFARTYGTRWRPSWLPSIWNQVLGKTVLPHVRRASLPREMRKEANAR